MQKRIPKKERPGGRPEGPRQLPGFDNDALRGYCLSMNRTAGARRYSHAGRPSVSRPAREDLDRLYVQEGRAVRDVARILEISKDLVYRSLREYGIELRPPAKRSRLRTYPLEDLREEIKRHGFRGAAAALGVDVKTLRRFMAARNG